MSAVIPDPALTDWVPLGGVGGGGSMIALQEVVVPAGGQATIDFASIPQGYRHLMVEGLLRGTAAAFVTGIATTFNGDSAANYDAFTAWLAAAYSGAATNASTYLHSAYAPGASATANRFGAVRFDIPNYADTAVWKSLISHTAQHDPGSAGVAMAGGTWKSLSAINRVALAPVAGGLWTAGSRATLYGIAAPITTLPVTGVRAVWGRVVGATGAIASGTGFTVSRTGAGQYTVTFNTPFTTVPTIIVQMRDGIVQADGPIFMDTDTVNGFKVYTTTMAAGSGSNFADHNWSFIAMEAA